MMICRESNRATLFYFYSILWKNRSTFALKRKQTLKMLWKWKQGLSNLTLNSILIVIPGIYIMHDKTAHCLGKTVNSKMLWLSHKYWDQSLTNWTILDRQIDFYFINTFTFWYYYNKCKDNTQIIYRYHKGVQLL